MRILGGILMAIGILIAGLSGLCSAVLIAEDIGDANAEWLESLWIIGLFGGIPFCVGAGLAVGGWFVIKQANKS